MPLHAAPTTNPSLIFRLTAAPHDAETWQQFVLLYGATLLAWCHRHGIQEADAQDISQEVLLRISRQIQRLAYDSSQSFRGWLRAVVHGAWCDWVEHQHSQKRQLFGHSNHLECLDSVAARDDLLARLEAQYDQELYEIAASEVRRQVEPSTWQAFQWLAVDQLSAEEVGARLGIKAASALAARYRVTALLRESVARLEKQR